MAKGSGSTRASRPSSGGGNSSNGLSKKEYSSLTNELSSLQKEYDEVSSKYLGLNKKIDDGTYSDWDDKMSSRYARQLRELNLQMGDIRRKLKG